MFLVREKYPTMQLADFVLSAGCLNGAVGRPFASLSISGNLGVWQNRLGQSPPEGAALFNYNYQSKILSFSKKGPTANKL